jgi:hypothetical protein
MLPVETGIFMSTNEISFGLDPGQRVTTQADFTYKIRPDTISIVDTNLGELLVTNDIEAVLRKIEYWHQGSIAAFKIMYRDEQGIWDGVNWDGLRASFFALREFVGGPFDGQTKDIPDLEEYLIPVPIVRRRFSRDP